jgi:hypothetical protein
VAAGFDRERDAVDCPHGAALGAVFDRKVFDVE